MTANDDLWVLGGNIPFRGNHASFAPFLFRSRPLNHAFGNLCLAGVLFVFLLFCISSLIMWWPPYCSQTRMWTATLSPGTGWCCCTVRWTLSCDKMSGLKLTSNLYRFLLRVLTLYFLKESELFLGSPYLWPWNNSLKSGKFTSWLFLGGKLIASF